SNKASIAELKELELLPDVEIMETPTEISITGCLYLQGKYTPVEETREKREGGTDTLVSALQFTPFPHEENQTSEFLYEPEAELSHRIPLNVSIPVDRVKEMGDVYAIVDGFDYQLVSANQLQIQADLKIAGISLQTEASDDTEYENEPEQDQVEWEFVHVAEDQEENNDFQPVSLDDIERKLAALEQEIETHQYKAPESHPYYNRKESSAYGYPKRAEQTESIAFAEESYGRQSSFGDITYAREAYDSQADYCDEEQDNKSDQEQHEAEQWETGYESPQISYTSEKRTRTEAEEVLASL
ncbi:hypothetical protein, partial [Bradyrhizobium japonicum]|uniref:hypothetical protein n=1 Tax=Bradyrhizobium japonicum TaxID=375 RepID=UPI00190F3218